MPHDPLRSTVIDRLMPDASEEEKAEAAHYWFEYLKVLAAIAARRMEERKQKSDQM
jgi:hypothetical protein